MKDRCWREAHQALLPILTWRDLVLAPRGGWAAFPCALRQYDGVVELGEATVFVLHKGRLPAIGKAELAAVVADWGCVYANEVFAVFARGRRSAPDVRFGRTWLHLRRVRAYLRSCELKRREGALFYLHLPKTGGTSLWTSLSRVVRSSIYYGDVRTFLANPPAPGDYDLVGVHFGPALLEGVTAPGDQILGLMREPTARFLSGVAHSRRPREDAATFTQSQAAMRELPLAEFLGTAHAGYEARVQLIQLGRAKEQAPPLEDGPLLERALAFVARDDVEIAPSEESAELVGRLERSLGLRLPRTGALNANDPADYAQYAEEFTRARPAIEALNEGERRLYAEVRARFARA